MTILLESTTVVDGIICTNACFNYGAGDITPDFLARFGPAFGNLIGKPFELVITNGNSYALTINNHTVTWSNGDPHISISFSDPLLASYTPGAFQWTDTELNQWGIGVSETLYGCPDPPVPGVPEPATWAMMMLGFVLLAGLVKLKRKRCPSIA